MSADMKGFFRAKLKALFNDLQRKRLEFEKVLHEDSIKESDFVDQSSLNQLSADHLAYNKLELNHLGEIELALQRIYNGNYGYCLVTGEPIGVKRLLAEPCAKYCLEAQMLRENVSVFNGK